jgi:HSP20 family protein
MERAVEDAITRAKTVYEWVTGQPAPEASPEAPYARIPPEVDREEHVLRQAAALFEKVRAMTFPNAAPADGDGPRAVEEGARAQVLPTPAAIVRARDEIRYVFELPGVAKQGIDVELRGNVLRVSADRPAITLGKGEQFVGSELLRARTERIVQLPMPVEPSAVTATFADGLLTVRVRISALDDKPIKIEVR